MKSFRKSLKSAAETIGLVAAFVFAVVGGSAMIVLPIAWVTILPSIGVLWIVGWLA